MREESRANFRSLEAKLDEHGKIINEHSLDIASSRARADNAHIRIDGHKSEHRELRGWWATLWVGVILLAVRAAWDFMKGTR